MPRSVDQTTLYYLWRMLKRLDFEEKYGATPWITTHQLFPEYDRLWDFQGWTPVQNAINMAIRKKLIARGQSQEARCRAKTSRPGTMKITVAGRRFLVGPLSKMLNTTTILNDAER